MSLARDPSLLNLNDCGCCEGTVASTPLEIANRPGLSAIAYRIGTHWEFKRGMLAALTDARRPALQGLNTRDDDDFTIALLDAWATVADVLTFYQERIANESYLRTATERLSIVELARELGYELAPGVAASTYLAFKLEDAPGAPGFATIDKGTKVQSIPGPGETPQTFETVEPLEAEARWNEIKPRLTGPQTLSVTMSSLLLERTDLNLKPGDMLLISASNGRAMRRIATVEPKTSAQQTEVTLETSGITAASAVSTRGVWALRVKAAPFGHNAPQHVTANGSTVTYGEWDLAQLDRVSNSIYLDSVYDRIQTGSWVVIDAPGQTRFIGTVSSQQTPYRGSVTDYGLAARITQLTLDGNWWTAPTSTAAATLQLLRGVLIYTQSEPLIPASVPLTTPLEKLVIPLETLYPGLAPNRTILVSGTPVAGGDPITESAVLDSVDDGSVRTTLTLRQELANEFKRDTVSIFANVALATHGETKSEVLGSGNAGQANQRFSLRQSPLTFIPADTATGGSSTLEVRVDDILWTEVPTLYGRGQRDRVYITRRDQDGKTTIQFGDGRAGARLPSGHENVKAVYRQGIGREGQVKAGQLSLLMTRPLGVKSVVNPGPATGAADPQETEDAQRNAPLTVLTLDRIVSLEDFADFARSFSGIAKALATWTWNGHARGVLVTVAGEDGDAVVEGGPLHTKLTSAMAKAGDPRIPIRVKSYTSVLFQVSAAVKVDSPTFLEDKVLADVRNALTNSFSFDARSFGQTVALSEVISVIQNVPGVVSVDVNQLYRESQPMPSPLIAFVPPPGSHAETVQSAELLTLDPDSLNGVEAQA